MNAVADFVGHMSLHAGSAESVNATLDRGWKTLTTALQECDGEPLKPIKPKPEYCRTAGMHICREPGFSVRKFRDALYSHSLKVWAKVRTPERQAMKEGRWCLWLRGEKATPPEMAGLGGDGPLREALFACGL